MIETHDRVQFTIRELGWWTVAICIAWAAPGWIGEHALWLSFYGILVFASWRLSKFVPLGCALMISITLAFLVTFVTVWTTNR